MMTQQSIPSCSRRPAVASAANLAFSFGAVAFSATLASVLLPTRPALAQTAPVSSTEAQAMAVLQRAEKRLQSLQSLQAEWTRAEKWDTTTFRPAEMRRSYYDFRLMKPLCWYCVTKSVPTQPQTTFTESKSEEYTEHSDGKTSTYLRADHTYSKGKVPPGNKALWGLAPVKGFFTGASGPATLFTNRRRLGDRAELTYIGKETWDGAEYDVVRMHFIPSKGRLEKTIVLYVGGDDLIHRWIETPPAGDTVYPVDEWQLHKVAINPALTDSDFALTLPADAKPYKTPAKNLPLPIGSVAPNFTVVDKAGKPVQLSDYKNKVVVLDFWATWCGPCIASMPHTNTIAKKFAAKNVVFLAVNTSDTMPVFTKWLTKNTQYPSLHFVLNTVKDVTSVPSLYHIRYIPTQYVIDRNGKIAAYFLNAEPAELEQAITKASVP